tara:strand:- start:1023 stop:1142 length:120 start_codon:yes stop_codon:yes gene_type:complete
MLSAVFVSSGKIQNKGTVAQFGKNATALALHGDPVAHGV